MKYTIKNVGGHYEAYDEFGNFLVSGDTRREVETELEEG